MKTRSAPRKLRNRLENRKLPIWLGNMNVTIARLAASLGVTEEGFLTACREAYQHAVRSANLHSAEEIEFLRPRPKQLRLVMEQYNRSLEILRHQEMKKGHQGGTV